MKNFKRVLLALVTVFAAVLLVACGAKSDNGTYVYKPSKTELKKLLEEQGISSSQFESIEDSVKFEISIKIKESKGTLNVKAEALGQKNEQSYDLKVNQKEKTFTSKEGNDEKIKYKVSGDVLTFDTSNVKDSEDSSVVTMLKNAKFKRTSTK